MTIRDSAYGTGREATGAMQMTSDVDDPLVLAQSNFRSVQNALVAAEARYERGFDGPGLSDEEVAAYEADIARLEARLGQRLGELNALETAAGLEATQPNDSIDDPAPRRGRLAALKDQRARRAT